MTCCGEVASFTAPRGHHFHLSSYWPLPIPTVIQRTWENTNSDHQRPRIARKRPGKQTAEAIGRRLLEIVVYDKCAGSAGR